MNTAITKISSTCLLVALLAPPSRADDPAPGRQVEQQSSIDGNAESSISFQFFLPEDYGKQEKKWPLMLFLHGRGESHGPLSLVKKWGPPKLVESDPSFPYVLVSPQCPSSESWSQPRQQELLLGLLTEIKSKYDVDENRVYLTGLSMGGYGSWKLAGAHPELFAAVVPICGGGDVKDAERLKDLPIWVFHGDQDSAVPLRRSVEMVDAIREAGGKKIRFTTLEDYGHNSWSPAYASPNLYEWLNQQARGSDAG